MTPVDVERLEVDAAKKRGVVLALIAAIPELTQAWRELLHADDAVFEAKRALRESGGA